MNRVTLAGRLAADPESVITKNGATVCRISVACNDISGRKDEVYFFPCVAWEARAKFISVYLKKGTPVVIDGRLQRKSYVNAEGNNVYNTEILIDNIRSFGSSNTSNYQRTEDVKQQDNFEEVNNQKIIKESAKNEKMSKVTFEEENKEKSDNIIEDFDLDWLDDIDN